MEANNSDFGDTVAPVVLDEVFQALSNATRRELLAYLDGRGESVAFDDLVAYLSAAADDRTETAGSANSADIRAGLHHSHLPKLEAAGLIEVSEGPTDRRVRSTRLLERALTAVLAVRSGV